MILLYILLVSIAAIVGWALLPGRWKCKLGFHLMDDCWCQRDGCDYHEVSN